MSPPCRRAGAAGSRVAPGACRCRSSGASAGFSARSCSRSSPSVRSSVASRTYAGMVTSWNFCSGPALQRAEVFLRVLVDGQRGEERREEIARREAEGAAVVGAVDLHEVVGADGFLRAPHAGGAVVVRGERQRPAAEHAVVIGQQLRGGFGGTVRIEALVDRVVDAHVAPAGGAHELPQAGGAHLRIRGGIERRLDMRQHRELGRQSLVGEGLGDMGFPARGADQAFLEAIGLAELKANALRGIAAA